MDEGREGFLHCDKMKLIFFYQMKFIYLLPKRKGFLILFDRKRKEKKEIFSFSFCSGPSEGGFPIIENEKSLSWENQHEKQTQKETKKKIKKKD